MDLLAPSLGAGVSPRNGSGQGDRVGRVLRAFFKGKTSSLDSSLRSELLRGVPRRRGRERRDVSCAPHPPGQRGEAAQSVGWVLKGEQGEP